MSVQLIQGDLLDWSAGPHSWNVAVHCVNAQGAMNSGVAKALRDRYPIVYDVYKKAYDERDLLMGTFTVADVGENRKVVNLVGQFRYGSDGRRYLDYEAFYSGFETLRNLLNDAHTEGRVYSLGIPHKIGCGLAGGEWGICSSMLTFLFDKSPVNCYIVQKS